MLGPHTDGGPEVKTDVSTICFFIQNQKGFSGAYRLRGAANILSIVRVPYLVGTVCTMFAVYLLQQGLGISGYCMHYARDVSIGTRPLD